MSNLLGSYSDSDSQELLNLPPLKAKKPKILGKRKRSPNSESDCLSYLKWLFCTLTVAGLIALAIVSYNLMYQIDEVRKNQNIESQNHCTPEEFQRLHTQIQELNKTLNNFKDGKNGLQSVLTKVNSLSTTVTELKQKTDDLDERVAKAPLLQTLPKKVDTTSKTLANLGSDMKNLQERVTTLQKKHQEATAKYADLTTKLKALEHDTVISEIDQLNITSIENMNALRKHLGELDNKMENEVLRVNNISAAVIQMSAQVYALNSSKSELQNQIQKLKGNISLSSTAKTTVTTTTPSSSSSSKSTMAASSSSSTGTTTTPTNSPPASTLNPSKTP